MEESLFIISDAFANLSTLGQNNYFPAKIMSKINTISLKLLNTSTCFFFKSNLLEWFWW